MFKTKKNLRAFIVMAVIFLFVVLNGIFTLGSVKNNPVSAWQSEIKQAGSSYFSNYVALHVNNKDSNNNDIVKKDDDGKYNVKVWLNVGRIFQSNSQNDKAVIIVRYKVSDGFTSTVGNKKEIEIKKGVNLKEGEYQFSWYCVEIPANTTFYSYYAIETKDRLEINEVAFTDTEGNLLSANVVGEGFVLRDNSSIDTEYTKAEDFKDDNTALNLLDEQNRFKEKEAFKRRYHFIETEVSTVNSVLSFGNGDGLYVADNAGALGIELISIGMSAFGFNTLGLRIVPYLFFALSIALIYALGSKLFKDTDAGWIFALIFVLAGLPMSLGGLGSVKTIGLFFALLSFYFILEFPALVAKCGFDRRDRKFILPKKSVLLPLIFAAVAFGFAFAADNTALFILPVNILVFVYGLVKANKVYKENQKHLEYEDEKRKNRTIYNEMFIGGLVAGIVGTLVVTAWFTLMFYAIAGSAYTLYYSTENLLTATLKAIGDNLFSGTNASFLGWIIGLGNKEIGSSVYLGTNVAVSILSLAAFVASTVVLVKTYSKEKSIEKIASSLKVYIPLTVGYIFTWAMFAFVKNADISCSLLSSVFGMAYIPLFISMMNNNGKTVKCACGKEISCGFIVSVSALVLIGLFFCLGYVMFAGIDVGKTASMILFGWWRY